MHRMGSWLYGRKPDNASLQSLELSRQIEDRSSTVSQPLRPYCEKLTYYHRKTKQLNKHFKVCYKWYMQCEINKFTNYIAAATLILNDDVDGAENGLSTGDSSFHKV